MLLAGLSGTFSPFTHHPHTSPATPSTRVLRFQVYVSELQPLRRELVRQVFRRLYGSRQIEARKCAVGREPKCRHAYGGSRGYLHGVDCLFPIGAALGFLFQSYCHFHHSSELNSARSSATGRTQGQETAPFEGSMLLIGIWFGWTCWRF